jgi:acid phosphatase
MVPVRVLLVIPALISLTACATAPAPAATKAVAHDPQQDLGLLWVKHAAEYGAITRQVYRSAEDDLPGYINDASWSAMPGQTDAADLPPAVILDVDETVVSNIDFQISFERPFTNRKLYDFYREHPAIPVPGVVEFIAAARDAGSNRWASALTTPMYCWRMKIIGIAQRFGAENISPGHIGYLC